MARSLIFLIMAITALPILAQPISIAGKECFELDGHPNERICLERRANQSRQTLKQAEASLGNALKNWDTEPEFKFKASQRLIKSVDAFHQYQKSQCEFQTSLSAGGNSADDRRLLCIIQLNEMRITELREAAASLP